MSSGLVKGWDDLLRKTLKHRGWIGTLRRSIMEPVYLIQDSRFDRKFGVATAGYIPLNQLDFKNPNRQFGSDYKAVRVHVVDQVIRSLRIKYQDFTFVDFGSGKGRALLLASEFPFKKIIGIEFSPQLNTIAQQNIQNYTSTSQKCKNMESICIDAAAYSIPPKPMVLFFYNPFVEPIMSKVLENIRRSLECYQRPIFIILYQSVVAGLFDDVSVLKHLKSSGTISQYCRIYTNL